ncbi:hypothetical protein LguiA_000478 [Lonicera macranthoides]
MLSRIHRWRTLPFFLKPPIILNPFNSLIFAKPSVSASIEDDASTSDESPSHIDDKDAVFYILSGLKTLGFSKFFGDDRFRVIISSLNSSQVDFIIGNLRVENPESAVELFGVLRSEYGFRHSRVSQLVIAHVLAAKGWMNMLRSLLQQMVQEEGSDSACSLCELLWNSFTDTDSNSMVWDMLAFAYSRSNMVHDALFVLAKMKDLNIQPSIVTYNSLLFNLRHSDIMWDVYNEIKSSGIPRSEYTNSILIDGLCKQSLIQEAVAFTLKTEGKEPKQVVSFNTLMSGFCKMGFIDVAKSFFCMMFKYGLRPDAYSYNILIHGLCLAGSIEEALEFTDDMEKHGLEPNVVTYNILAKGFHLLGRMRGAWKIIDHMLQKGLNPDIVTYAMLICGHCRKGNIEEALKLQEKVLSRGFQLSNITYTVLFSSLCKSGRADEAMSLLRQMETIGFKPDLVMYSVIIQGFCKKGEVERAIQLYEEMCLRRIHPNCIAHRAILLGLCEKGTIKEARMYFDQLTDMNLMKDIVLYNIMIDRYAKIGDIEEAQQLYRQIIEKGITPSIVTFNSLINGFCKTKKLANARGILDTIKVRGLVPSVVTYTTLMNALCEDGSINAMFELLREMESRAIGPTHVTYTVVIKGLCKQRKLQESVQLLGVMSSKAYGTLIKAHCVKGDVHRAMVLFCKMVEKGFEISIRDYSAVINRLCKRRLTNEAKQFVHMMLSNDISLDQQICSVMLNSFHRFSCYLNVMFKNEAREIKAKLNSVKESSRPEDQGKDEQWHAIVPGHCVILPMRLFFTRSTYLNLNLDSEKLLKI